MPSMCEKRKQYSVNFFIFFGLLSVAMFHCYSHYHIKLTLAIISIWIVQHFSSGTLQHFPFLSSKICYYFPMRPLPGEIFVICQVRIRQVKHV